MGLFFWRHLWSHKIDIFFIRVEAIFTDNIVDKRGIMFANKTKRRLKYFPFSKEGVHETLRLNNT